MKYRREDLINGQLLYHFAVWLEAKRELSPSTIQLYVRCIANLYSREQLNYAPRRSAIKAYIEFLRTRGIDITYDEFIEAVCTEQPPSEAPQIKIETKPETRLRELIAEAFERVEREERARAPVPSLRDLAKLYNRLRGFARAVVDLGAPTVVYLNEQQVRMIEVLEKANVPLPHREGNVLIFTPQKAAEMARVNFDEAFKRIARVQFELSAK